MWCNSALRFQRWEIILQNLSKHLYLRTAGSLFAYHSHQNYRKTCHHLSKSGWHHPVKKTVRFNKYMRRERCTGKQKKINQVELVKSAIVWLTSMGNADLFFAGCAHSTLLEKGVLPQLGNLQPEWQRVNWRARSFQKSSEPQSKEQHREKWRPCHCTTPYSSPPEWESAANGHAKGRTCLVTQRKGGATILLLVWTQWPIVTWKTVTMAQSKESKFFLSGTVSPASVFKLNLQPNMCIPRILEDRDREDFIYNGMNPRTCNGKTF